MFISFRQTETFAKLASVVHFDPPEKPVDVSAVQSCISTKNEDITNG